MYIIHMNNTDHQLKKTNVIMSDFMKRMYMKISEENGCNINNRASINHGMQILFFREMKRRGINLRKEYINIRM